VKVAFRDLARKYHPDKAHVGGVDDGGERFKRLRKAFEILSDGTKMAAFNEAARAARCRADLERKNANLAPKQAAGNAHGSAPDFEGPKLPATGPKMAV
jgi:DnaJ-class molecular chaperone